MIQTSGTLLAVGSGHGRTPGHNKAEVLVNDGMWMEIDAYSFHSTIWRMATLYHEGDFYTFGGVFGDVTDNTRIIARLDSNFKWSKIGELVTQRRSHAVIVTRGQFLVVGGHNQDDTEVMYTEHCSIGQTVKCENQKPLLRVYQLYPELFPVTGDFCKTRPQSLLY